MKIRVTKFDIDGGRPFSPEGCPVALAVQRRTKKSCSIGPFESWVGGWMIRTPSKVQEFIRNYDSSLPVSPFDFELDLEGKL